MAPWRGESPRAGGSTAEADWTEPRPACRRAAKENTQETHGRSAALGAAYRRASGGDPKRNIVTAPIGAPHAAHSPSRSAIVTGPGCLPALTRRAPLRMRRIAPDERRIADQLARSGSPHPARGLARPAGRHPALPPDRRARPARHPAAGRRRRADVARDGRGLRRRWRRHHLRHHVARRAPAGVLRHHRAVGQALRPARRRPAARDAVRRHRAAAHRSERHRPADGAALRGTSVHGADRGQHLVRRWPGHGDGVGDSRRRPWACGARPSWLWPPPRWRWSSAQWSRGRSPAGSSAAAACGGRPAPSRPPGSPPGRPPGRPRAPRRSST